MWLVTRREATGFFRKREMAFSRFCCFFGFFILFFPWAPSVLYALLLVFFFRA
jgi:hypothetical protein